MNHELNSTYRGFGIVQEISQSEIEASRAFLVINDSKDTGKTLLNDAKTWLEIFDEPSLKFKARGKEFERKTYFFMSLERSSLLLIVA